MLHEATFPQPVPPLPTENLLDNFNRCIAFVQEAPPTLTSAGQLAVKDAKALNARLTVATETRLARPVLKSYPYVLGLYWLLRASGLTRLQFVSRKTTLVIDPEALATWNALTPAEQYAALLEIFLLWADPAAIGEGGMPGYGIFLAAMWWRLLEERQGTQTVATPKEAERYQYHDKSALALLHLFGVVTVTAAPPVEGKGWQFATISITSFGRAIFPALIDALHQQKLAADIDAPEMRPLVPAINRLQPFFAARWPEVRQALALRQTPVGAGKLMRLAVRFGAARCVFAVPSEAAIVDLVEAILQSVRFANDHLWYFEFPNAHATLCRVAHPMLEDGIPAFDENSDLALSELPIRAGDQWLFVFDMGDDWRFDLQWEAITAHEAGSPETIALVEKSGKPPLQYGRS
jgi:hypothetical protein